MTPELAIDCYRVADRFERSTGRDPDPLSRCSVDFQPSIHGIDTLLHTDQAQPSSFAAWIEAHAIISDIDDNTSFTARTGFHFERDRGFACVRMFGDICQRFLHDAIDGNAGVFFQRRPVPPPSSSASSFPPDLS